MGEWEGLGRRRDTQYERARAISRTGTSNHDFALRHQAVALRTNQRRIQGDSEFENCRLEAPTLSQ